MLQGPTVHFNQGTIPDIHRIGKRVHKGTRLGVVLLRVLMCVCAVSYTHLDVYKRQVSGTNRTSSYE